MEHVGNINSHSQPTLNLILSPDPDPEQSGLLKGGGWERGVEHVGNINSHSQPTLNLILSPEPENIVLCRNKTEKMFKH